MDAAGFNAIDFAEFVFLPGNEQVALPTDYVAELLHYYYFQPTPLHHVNAWKRDSYKVDLVESGGHRAEFPGRKIVPEQFTLRHYIGLTAEHLKAKYLNRAYSDNEVRERGWHRKRASWAGRQLLLPNPTELHKLGPYSPNFETSRPHREHLFQFVTCTLGADL